MGFNSVLTGKNEKRPALGRDEVSARMSAVGKMDQKGELTGLIYGTSIDSEMWADLLSETFELSEVLSGDPADSRPDIQAASDRLESILQHISQASAIAEQMLNCREVGQFLEQSLGNMSFGLAYFDDDGDLIWASSEMRSLLDAPGGGDDVSAARFMDSDEEKTRTLRAWVQGHKFSDKAVRLHLAGDNHREEFVFLPRQQIEHYGLPARAAAALIHVDLDRSEALQDLARKFDLTPREQALVEQLLRTHDLREAGTEIGITYQTARSYLRRIFEKTGCTNQSELVARVFKSPSSLLRKTSPSRVEEPVRRIFTLSCSRKMEAFVLGPKRGFAVVTMPSNIEAIFDVLNETDTFQRILNDLNLRIVMPQWPGAYRSEPVGQDYQQDNFASDIVEIMDQLGAKTFSVFSTGFSTDEALRLAHDFPDRVRRVVLASAHNSTTADQAQKDTDPFFNLTKLLVRKSHRLGRALLGLMWRQIAQDPGKKARFLAKSSGCKADRDLYISPELADRERGLLALRFAQGFEGQIHRAIVRIRPRSFDLRRIKTPVEIFNSDKETITPLDDARLLADELPNCTFRVLSDAGHAHAYRNWPWLVARAAGQGLAPGSVVATYGTSPLGH